MYAILRNGIPQGNSKFTSYETARQTVRKWLRKKYPVNAVNNEFHYGFIGWTSNPQIGDFGYSIKRVR